VITHPPRLAARCLVLLAACLLVAPGARAEEEEPLGYQGAYWGLQAHLGVLLPDDLTDGSLPGPAYGVSARLATLASLVDIQATFLAGHYTRQGLAGGTVNIDRLSFGIEAHGHPFLTLMLKGDFLFQWLASLYGSFGLDLDLAQAGDGRWFHDAGLKLGGGSDVALTDVNQGWALWLGFSYHTKISSIRVPGLGALGEHIVLLTIAYRNNDIYFMRAPRPDEVQYREHPLDD